MARFKRGSAFNGKLQLKNGISTYTNYGDENDPLPVFAVPTTPGSGPVLQAMAVGGGAGVTIDGLHFTGARGDGTMNGLMGGIGIFLGGGNVFINNEISDCDIGMMLGGTGNLIQNNYVHDLIMGVDSTPDTDANVVGGAEGIFINESDNEVSFDSFVRCAGYAQWVDGRGGSDCDGGATEVSVPTNSKVWGVKIHHNFSYESCGFLELATVFSDVMGVFRDAEIYSNVSVNSQWLVLLQVSNTLFQNVHFYNNTIYRGNDGTFDWFLIATILASGRTGGELTPGEVRATNNLFVRGSSTQPFGQGIPEAIAQTTNLDIWSGDVDPGFVNQDGVMATDYALTASSPAVNAGTAVPSHTADYLGHAIPDSSGVADIGAFEYDSTEQVGESGPTGEGIGEATDPNPSAGGSDPGTGGAGSGTGGAGPATGGAGPATGGVDPGTGGVPEVTTYSAQAPRLALGRAAPHAGSVWPGR